MIRKILILGHSNIGDVCYDLAVVRPLADRHPQAGITLLVSPRCRDIAAGYPGLTRIITFDRRGRDRGLAGNLRFIRDIRRERFDLVVVLKHSQAWLLLGGRRVWRVTGDMRRRFNHPVDRYLHLLRHHGLGATDHPFRFGPDGENKFCEETLGRLGIADGTPLAGIMPLAAWSLKSWPVERWNELARRLEDEHGLRTLALGRLPDSPLGRRIRDELSPRIPFPRTETLSQAKALLGRCRVFIGPDSSFLHLASIRGIPAIGLYGATSPDHYFPYFHRHLMVRSGAALACMPCVPGPGPSCNREIKHDFGPCMQEITVEQVMKKIEKVMLDV